MTELPDRIWALADRRKYWQEESPQDGQHDWHWTEYTRTDKAQARIAELEAALSQLRSVVSPFPSEDTERYREEYYACERADAALKGKTDV
jgi:hypothetical protein